MLHQIIDENMAARRQERLFNSDAMITVQWDTLLGDGAPIHKVLMQLPWRMLFPLRETGRYHPARHWRRLKNFLTRTLE